MKLAEEGKHEEALHKFAAAIQACPQNPSPYNNRAQAYRLLKRHEGDTRHSLEQNAKLLFPYLEALTDIEKAIELSDGKGKSACQAYVQRGLIHRLQGKDDDAKVLPVADFGARHCFLGGLREGLGNGIELRQAAAGRDEPLRGNVQQDAARCDWKIATR